MFLPAAAVGATRVCSRLPASLHARHLLSPPAAHPGCPTQVRLYDVGSARLLRLFTVGAGQQSSQPAAAGAVTAISWFPDGARFVAATHKAVEVFDSRHGGGGLLHRLRSPHAFTYDVAVAGSDCLITVGQDRKIGFTRCGWAHRMAR